MMRLVLVDDEKGITDGLKTLVRRYLPQCEVVGTAHNGNEGWKLVQEMQPDIVITDIRMPQSDGLSMIRRLIESGSRAKFIILSGYAEFEYAKKGIELGVKFYINKPVEEEELEDCVTKVIAEINSEKAQSRHWHDFVLKDVLVTGYDPQTHEGHISYLFPLPVTRYDCACILVEFGCEPGMVQEDYVLRQARDVFKPYDQLQVIRYEGSQFAVLVMHEGKINEEYLIQDVRRLQEEFSRVLGISVSAGIGRAYPAPAGLSTSFDEAQQSLWYKVMKGNHVVIAFRETEPSSSAVALLAEEELVLLETCMEQMDNVGSAEVIHRIFRAIEKQSNLHLADLQHQILLILVSSMRRISFTQLQMNDLLGKYLLSVEELARFKTLEELKLWVIQAIDRISDQNKIRQAPKKKDVISEIKEYVAAHYDSNITLADLSARFYINPFYLSQLFKEKTGDTYLSYLMGVRMNKAKELLMDTDLKVYEICQRVGYADTSHFSKLFERMVGCTPTEYRKKCKI
ncbi:helix-turn-helix domain-containing protein [Paenibacillus qinlingensis]|uniref:Two-component system response regulator YesN n=1 Tax=Paenibacillus qinlingensis TaxID=1837343 RepID=A0ABU1P077_9BACL|nr:helix-turn-helix domain-containing protein [Paenibacillus qinlingensis]MDR6553155.1 two-component system response regulator YesN [Paenibacillus qinlingensis]